MKKAIVFAILMLGVTSIAQEKINEGTILQKCQYQA